MPPLPPALGTSFFHPGQRVTVAVSGGADSVALLRRLLEERGRLGIVLSIAHLHHGIRGDDADADADFVARLAAAHDLPFHLGRVDAPAEAAEQRKSLEEAARNLRYAFFERVVAVHSSDLVATAHTLDDQAETVLQKIVRGAWTEGLSGIHAVVPLGRGSVVRPFLETSRAAIELWLGWLGQPWREDASNLDLAYTRNRIRHQTLPSLAAFNPQIARQLAHMAALSADEEAYWRAELGRLLPSLLLPGKPVRGGGRSSSTHPGEAALAVELVRLEQLHPAVRRRVLRAAARQLGSRLNFDHTERLLALSDSASSGRKAKLELPGGLIAERSLREIRFTRSLPGAAPAGAFPEYHFVLPGDVHSKEFGVHLHGEVLPHTKEAAQRTFPAILRGWKKGDRVILRHSRGPKKVKEVLDRLHVDGPERERWPLIESEGKIVWMRGVEVDAAEFLFTDLASEPEPSR